jgi:predicted hydrocarbon binding protein
LQPALGEIQSTVSKLIGTGSAAVMREAGRSASHKLWPDLPAGKTPEEAGAIMAEGVKEVGGWGESSITGVDDGVAKIEFKQCYFASLSKESGQPIGHQPICHFGFGLVEETFKRLTGITAKVELVKRDDGTETCFETATPR